MGVNLITTFVQWLTCGNAPATASTVCSVAASRPTSRFNISTAFSVSNLYSDIALSDRMPKDAFSVIRGKTTKGKTALNFKHFESRREREIMPSSFCSECFYGLRSKLMSIWFFFSSFFCCCSFAFVLFCFTLSFVLQILLSLTVSVFVFT